MKHLMIDLETMGTASTAPIVAIAAVFFEPETGVIGAEFYTPVLLSSEMENGARPDAGAINWWLMQSPEARSAIVSTEAKHVDIALFDLISFVNEYGECKSLRVWGNGSSFDCVILHAAFVRSGMMPFWKYSDERDVRTIVEIGRQFGFDPKHDMPFAGDRHNALADAKHQAQYVSAIWQKIIPRPAGDTNAEA